jgi:hypothetical protein
MTNGVTKGVKVMYTKLKSATRALSLAIVLLMLATVGSAQTESVSSMPKAGTPSGPAPTQRGKITVLRIDGPHLNPMAPNPNQVSYRIAFTLNEGPGDHYLPNVYIPSQVLYLISPTSHVYASICATDLDGFCFDSGAHPEIYNIIPGYQSLGIGYHTTQQYYSLLSMSILIDP